MNEERNLPGITPNSGERVRITIELSRETLVWIDELRVQLGFRSRGIIIEQLLLELHPSADDSDLRQLGTGSGWLARASRFLKHFRDRIPFL
jgi:hypothetical protein